MPDRPNNIVPLTPKAVSSVEEFLAQHDRELLTILFTDLVDSTQLQSELGNAESARLTELHRKIVREELAQYDAREIEWAGDSCLAVFTKPSDGIVFALKLQAALRDSRRSEPKTPKVRIGLHLGEIVVRHHDDGSKHTEDLFGLQVSEAARVMSLARGDQIFCTRPVFDNARNTLRGADIPGVRPVVWLNHGPYELKGSDEPVEICEVGENDLAPLRAPAANDKCRPVLHGGAARDESRSSSMKLLTAAALGLVVGTAAMWMLNSAQPVAAPQQETPDARPEPIRRYVVATVERPRSATSRFHRAYSVALSPDGKYPAYVNRVGTVTRLHLRRMDDFEDVVLVDGDRVRGPFFSPDSQWVGYYSDVESSIMKVSVHRGTPIPVVSAQLPRGASWGPDNRIIFPPEVIGGLHAVSANGGLSEPITQQDSDGALFESDRFPFVLPDGRAVLFTRRMAAGNSGVMVRSLETGEERLLYASGMAPQYSPTGHLLFAQAGALLAMPFDIDSLEPRGEAVPVLQGVAMSETFRSAQYALSNDGTLAYVPGSALSAVNQPVWVDRSGGRKKVPLEPEEYAYPMLSPDGHRLAVAVGDRAASDIWLYDFRRDIFTRFTTDQANQVAVWTPDGARIAFSRSDVRRAPDLTVQNTRIFWMASDLSEPTEPLWNGVLASSDGFEPMDTRTISGTGTAPSSFSPDGRLLAFRAYGVDTQSDIWIMPTDGSGAPEPFVLTDAQELAPDFSPDGRWIAYVSNSSGEEEIYVQSYPGPGAVVQVSNKGGTQPRWSADGTEIFYRESNTTEDAYVMAVPVTTDPLFSAGTPVPLFEDDFAIATALNIPNYDVTADGQRFLMLEGDQDSPTYEIRIVTNFFKILNDLAPHPEAK